MKQIKMSFTGCGLGDFIYNNIDFNSPEFLKFISATPGDGGLYPGKLVFTNELERFSGKHIEEIIADLKVSEEHDVFNIGGPALVSCICARQLLYNAPVEVYYFGATGNDKKSKVLADMLKQLSLPTDNLHVFDVETPYTTVLSDPYFNAGRGERTFINNIGAAGHYSSKFFNVDFWSSDIVVFGGTALVPQLHSELTDLLQLAKSNRAFTVVNTVYDFPNEKKNPNKPWPLGKTAKSLPLIDLLIMDYEEAKRISGEESFEAITSFYKSNGSAAFIITHGCEPTYIFSSGRKFNSVETFLPVCNWISERFVSNPELRGDTTGCGDNFAGAAIASVAMQMREESGSLSLSDAAVWGTISGGFTCFYVGGTYFEKYSGERLEKMYRMKSVYDELFMKKDNLIIIS